MKTSTESSIHLAKLILKFIKPNKVYLNSLNEELLRSSPGPGLNPEAMGKILAESLSNESKPLVKSRANQSCSKIFH